MFAMMPKCVYYLTRLTWRLVTKFAFALTKVKSSSFTTHFGSSKPTDIYDDHDIDEVGDGDDDDDDDDVDDDDDDDNNTKVRYHNL